jgi:tRNA-Thr(GGU) m(6)t(6)A37 methyltransferase TsaA
MRGKGELSFIGVVETNEKQEAKIHIFPEFCSGLKGIKAFSHLLIFYWIHLRDNEKDRHTLLVFPRRHTMNEETGVFACRSPSRPNPIGLCVVELLTIEECVLTVEGLDALEGSPIIDIKPYLPRADAIPDATVPDWTLRGPTT